MSARSGQSGRGRGKSPTGGPSEGDSGSQPEGQTSARAGGAKVDQGSMELAHDQEAIRAAEHALLDAVSKAKFPEASAFAIRLALEEALYNAFRHGHRDKPQEKVRLEWSVEPHQVSISVTDRGPGFDPDALPDPTSSERIELPHGRGVMLMRAYMTSVTFEKPGNRVTMVYRRPDETPLE